MTEFDLRVLQPCVAGLVLCVLSGVSVADSSVFKVSKDDEHLYVGGTIHMLAESDFPLPVEFDQAYKNAELIVFETDIAALGSPKTQEKFAQRLAYTDGSSLPDHIAAKTYESLTSYLSERGLPPTMLDAYKPGLVMSYLTIIELQRLGMAGIGVDQYFSDKAAEDHKKTDGLESIDQQISFLVAIGDAEPDAVLQYTIDEMNKLEQVMVDIKHDWRHGVYTTSLDKFMQEMKVQTPDLYVMLMQNRNEAWLHQIESLMATPATEFVMVGVAHLAGEDSLLDMLASRGYLIEPL